MCSSRLCDKIVSSKAFSIDFELLSDEELPGLSCEEDKLNFTGSNNNYPRRKTETGRYVGSERGKNSRKTNLENSSTRLILPH